MKRILVTGGCGFVGTNVIPLLFESGFEAVRVLDNEILGRRENIEDYPVEFVAGDVRDRRALRTALDGVSAVIHLAADTRVIDSMENPEFNFSNNVLGTFNLMDCMREMGVTRLVNASTGGAILGEVEPPVHEDMVARPMSPYGASKLAAEGYCSAFATCYNFSAISLRFSNVYGPRSFHKGSVVAHFFRRILAGEELVVYGDGNQTRDFVFTADLCNGIVLALESKKNGVFQLGTGRPTTVNKLIELIRHTVGPSYKIEVRYEKKRTGEIYHTWCDIGKAGKELHYNPVTDLPQGLEKTWEWFRSASFPSQVGQGSNSP